MASVKKLNPTKLTDAQIAAQLRSPLGTEQMTLLLRVPVSATALIDKLAKAAGVNRSEQTRSMLADWISPLDTPEEAPETPIEG